MDWKKPIWCPLDEENLNELSYIGKWIMDLNIELIHKVVDVERLSNYTKWVSVRSLMKLGTVLASIISYPILSFKAHTVHILLHWFILLIQKRWYHLSLIMHAWSLSLNGVHISQSFAATNLFRRERTLSHWEQVSFPPFLLVFLIKAIGF